MKSNFQKSSGWPTIEPLESRIAPAGLPLLNESGFKPIVTGSTLLLHAGEGLSTGGSGSGAYLVYVVKGTAEIFTTDFNNNKQVDFNEITGISAGDGLQIILFSDIHGDIVTNLNADGSLSDSDNNASNGRDGLVLLNSRIEMITTRSLQASDINTSLANNTVASHTAIASHSIYGGIYAGAGFGLADGSGGLFIGTPISADVLTQINYNGSISEIASVGPIKVGTAASGQHISFGSSFGGPLGSPGHATVGDIQGILSTFTPLPGQTGADINGIHAIDGNTPFNISSLKSGNGGFGAPGGAISNVTITSDTAGGYSVVAGNGGRGLTGGAGGSIVNFSDLGSITSAVEIKSGDGGQGLTGSGGAGGTIAFGRMHLAAAMTMTTGSGGNGFTNGGAGASFLAGVFTTPDSILSLLPEALALASTTRNLDPYVNTIDPSVPIGSPQHQVPGMPANFWPSIPSIGSTQAIDFDHDGFGDVVFTTTNPDQVVVLFGSSSGYDFSKTLFLAAPENPGALVVGDFNNDGHPDIAVASASGSFSGVSVFLSKYETINGTGVPSKFAGFSDALQSTFPVVALPLGADTPPFDEPTASNQTLTLRLAVGDFNGDHINDLAVQLEYQGAPRVVFLTGDVDGQGFGSGHFYPNFGNGTFADVTPIYGPTLIAFGTPVVAAPTGPMKASVLEYNDDSTHSAEPSYIYNFGAGHHDYVFLGTIGSTENALTVIDNFNPSITGPFVDFTAKLGKVDTERKYPDENGLNISLTAATLQDFALLDANGADPITKTHAVDIIALTKAPTDFLVAFEGTPSGSALFKIASSPNALDQNSGISIGARDAAPTPAPAGFAPGADSGNPDTAVMVGIIASPNSLTNEFSNVAVMNDGFAITELDFPNPDQPTAPMLHVVHSDGVALAEKPATLAPLHNGNYAFDLVYGSISSSPGYGALMDSRFVPSVVPDVGYVDYHFDFFTGNGGSGTLGSGGSAGSLGASKLTLSSSVLGSSSSSNISLTFAFPNPQLIHTFRLDGPSFTDTGVQLSTGDGGNGFINGGAGGLITGVNLNGTIFWDAQLFTGHGGNGFTGTGGVGGNIAGNHINPGSSFIAGDGGNGSIGGKGGSIIGNGFPVSSSLFDTISFDLVVIAGRGGDGLKRGGSGGDLQNFTASFSIDSVFIATGFHAPGLLSYHAGDGGNAVSGPGGNGGSILSSSPIGAINFLSGDIDLLAGYGGNGLTGGSGGSIDTFLNKPSDPSVLPGAISIVAGNAGDGVSGNGGTGGGISNVNVAGYGLGKSSLNGAKFNRVIAGQGGISYGGAGGTGGSVLNVEITAQSGAMVVVSGAGGQGLSSGGSGGGIINSLINSSGNAAANLTVGKVVVIAGEGGDTLASLPFNHANFGSTPTDLDILKSFGGVNGQAGNGGSILSFQQPTSLNTEVDLIAGNGGSTVNYGSSQDASGGVGRGGSISGAIVLGGIDGLTPQANINGNIGNSDAAVGIKAYNNTGGDYHADETMRAFVDQTFRDQFQIYSQLVDDSLGNVGLVAGAAGHVFKGAGASYGVNGSVSNLLMNTGQKILSMVAGAVDSIAKIQSISGVRLASGGPIPSSDLGADKDFPGSLPGALDYYDTLGAVVHVLPQSGFGLIDGVIFASNAGGLIGARVEQA